MFYNDLKTNGHFILKDNFFNINNHHVNEFHNIFNDPNQKHINHREEIIEDIVIIDDINKHPHLKNFTKIY